MDQQDGAWIPYPFPGEDAPLDVSFLYEQEKPAGRRGFLAVRGPRLVFEDGTPARFWGTCFNSAANFPTREQAERIAVRLAKFGVNLVRTHQLDAEWSTPNIFQLTKGLLPKDTRSFDPRSLDRLDYLIHCLKEQGIYTFLDLLCYRRFKPGDAVAAADHLPKAARPYSNFDSRLIELQKEYIRSLATHVNPYTGLAYCDDPAIALVNLVNENDLVSHQRDANAIVLEPYRRHLLQEYRTWLRGRGEKHHDPVLVDLAELDPLLARFLLEKQTTFYRAMTEYCREIGLKVPISGSNWGGGLLLLSALKTTDFTDTHAYWDMWSDTSGSNELMLGRRRAVWPPHVCSQRLLDKPLFVSEWDSVWPNEWRAESPLIMAALCAHQDFGGAAIHTYRYRCTPVESIGGVVMDGVGYRVNFDTFNDPAKFGLFYHAALLFRRGDVRPAERTAGVAVSEERLFNSFDQEIAALWPAAETHRTGVVLPGDDPPRDLTLFAEDETPPPAGDVVVSDTGEVGRHLKQAVGWIDTPRTKAAYGRLGDIGNVDLSGVEIRCAIPFAVVALSSLCNEPIDRADNLLLTAVARADNTGARYDQRHTVRLAMGAAPILVEVVHAEIRIATSVAGLTVRSIDPEGFHTGTVPSRMDDGALCFTIGSSFPSIYYLIQRLSAA